MGRTASRVLGLGSALALAMLLMTGGVAWAITGPPPVMEGTVTGRVTDEVTGLPISGVQVTPYRFSGGLGTFGTPVHTGLDGRYSMTIEIGTYKLEFLDPSGAHASMAWRSAPHVYAASAETVTVAWAQTETCDAEMKHAASFRVQLVTEATNGPVASGEVGYLEQSTGSAWGSVTDAEGWTSKRGLSPGRWWVVGTAIGFLYSPQPRWYAANGSPDVTITADTTTTLTVPLRHHPSVYRDVVRKSGPTRYETALEMAKETFPGWQGVTDVVVASGEDQSLVDALSASGLAGSYNAPLLLVRRDSVPQPVAEALAVMPLGVNVHIVGGPPAVSDGVRAALDAMPRVGNVDRISGPTRYDTAAEVARWMKARIPGMPSAALVANGANPANFYDALALAPVAYRAHIPILLVARDYVPAPTTKVLADLGLTNRYIGGGPPAVSVAVQSALGIPDANRLAGPTRYGTAVAIAKKAKDAGWLDGRSFGIASSLPDALAAGPMMGRKGGIILLTAKGGSGLAAESAQHLFDTRAVLELGITCGGANVIPESVRLGTMSSIN